MKEPQQILRCIKPFSGLLFLGLPFKIKPVIVVVNGFSQCDLN